VAARLDPVCDRFESAWLSGQRPSLESHLNAGEDADRPALLRELLALDLHYRVRHGERPTLEEYRLRFPAYAELIERLFIACSAGSVRSPLPATGEAETPADTPRAPAPESHLPERVGRYALEGEIARGGMGVVVRARDLDLGRPLALKVLLAPGNAELERRFREEAQITGQLQHPGVPPIHELGALPDGRPFLAMKLIAGRTLAEVLGQRATPADDLPHLLSVFEAVCQTVAYAHSKGVIHRDLKPANVMVGAFGEVQVMDWGLAKALVPHPPAPSPKQGEGEQDTRQKDAAPLVPTAHVPAPPLPPWERGLGGEGSHTQTGIVLGTPAYMAPEQARGEVDQLDQRCDVFGLGAILCVLLTGKPPYAGSSRAEVHEQARHAVLAEAWARLEASGADGELVRLARQCLAAHKEDRPGNAGAVAAAVGAYREGAQARLRRAEQERAAAEARAQEAGARARVERWARRLTVALAAAVFLLAVAGGGVAWMVQSKRVRQGQADKDARAALLRADDWLTEGWEAQDLGKLKEAKAESERAVAISHSGDASAAVRQEAAGLHAKVEEKWARAVKNDALMAALLDGPEPPETQAYTSDGAGALIARDPSNAHERCKAAFQRWGLDMTGTAVPEVVARLRREPEVVRQAVLAALDVWMLEVGRLKRPEKEGLHLLRVAEALDDSPQRRRLRALLLSEAPPRVEAVVGLFAGWPAAPALAEVGLARKWRQVQELRRRVNPAKERPLTLFLLGLVCRRGGDSAGAEEMLRKALAAKPNEEALLTALGKLLESQRPPRLGEAIECYRAIRAKRPSRGVALAGALTYAGRGEEGEDVMRDLVGRQPNNPEMHLYLGLTLAHQKKPKLAEAVAAYRESIRLSPTLAPAHFNLGMALSAQKKFPEAIVALKEATRLRPKYPEAYNNLGNILANQKEWAEAEEAFAKAIKLKPGLAQVHFNRALALSHQGKRKEAVAAYEGAIRVKANFPEAYNNMGNTLRQLGKLPEAIRALEESIRLRADFPDAHYNLGLALAAQRKFSKAAAAFREAIRWRPDHIGAYTDLGTALGADGKPAEAVAILQKAIRVRPDYPEAHNNLGTALRELGKLHEAVAAYKEAVRLKDDFPEAHLGLGFALGDLGHFEESLAALRKADELGQKRPTWRHPSLHWVRQAERMVELDRKLSAFRAGKFAAATADEQLGLADLCQHRARRLYAASACFYSEAFAARPVLTYNLAAGYRYNAARSAALAGCGAGEDEPRPDETKRADLRKQALLWLRGELGGWTIVFGREPVKAGPYVVRAMRRWQGSADLTGVRDKDGLARLSEEERKGWEKLWADVEALRKRAEGK
jgi:tetratricopeptide (TPR) repeat protein